MIAYKDGGWYVLDMDVRDWGTKCERPARLPDRWMHGADGRGTVEPSGLEYAAALHLAEHGLCRKRLLGRPSEVMLLAECRALFESALPADALAAAARGESLHPWCPGVSWHWQTEHREGPWAA